jgi:hypothetical protein
MLKFLPQIIIVVCIFTQTFIYVRGIRNNTVKPILATRVFLLLAFLLTFLTNYSQTGVHGLSANIFNIVDFLSIFATFLAMAKSGNNHRKWTKFEKICLYIVILIFLIWIVSGQNILANILIQIILVIAYLPTLIHLWKSKENTESLSAWSFDFIASIFGMVIPLQTMDLLPLIYGVRSTISTFAIILLIWRIKFKEATLEKNNLLYRIPSFNNMIN